jgi:hypothetical protein
VQAIGSGLAAAGPEDQFLSDGGNSAIIAGIVLQVFVLAGVGILGLHYFLRARKHMKSSDVKTVTPMVWREVGFCVRCARGVCLRHHSFHIPVSQSSLTASYAKRISNDNVLKILPR